MQSIPVPEEIAGYSVMMMFVNAVLAIFTGFFAFGYDSDPAHCNKQWDLGKRDKTQIYDFGEIFEFGFRALFFFYIAMVIMGTISYIVNSQAGKQALCMVNDGFTVIVAFIWMWVSIWRFTPGGRYCSGDMKGVVATPAGMRYLWEEGEALFWSAIVGTIVLILFCIFKLPGYCATFSLLYKAWKVAREAEAQAKALAESSGSFKFGK